MEFLQNLNWVAVGQIILIDLLLGGDNAIVIALACRNLPENLRLRGILWGTVGAIAIRIVLIAFAVTMLGIPYLKIIGGLLLIWIGIKLLADEGDEHGEVEASSKLFTAIKTIIIADLVMSIDNVVAVASAASEGGDHQLALVVFGIMVSIPIIIWGSTLVLKMMERLPIIVTFGAGLLGYLAGEMIVSDSAIAPWLEAHWPSRDFLVMNLHFPIPSIVGAVIVVATGWWLAKRHQRPEA
jgi:YjbE family integral membrane protein